MADRPSPEHRRALRRAFKQRELAEADARLPLPKPQLAALFHYVGAHMEAEGCDHSLRFSEAFLDEHALDVAAVTAWLRESGGFCDCEVLANVESEWADRL